jgi:predicted lipoprotein
MSPVLPCRMIIAALLLAPLSGMAQEPRAPAAPAEESAGAATLESNRAAMARTVSDTAAIAAYQQQLVQFREQQAQYREQMAEAQRQAEAYRAAQARYAAQLESMKSKPEVVAPRPESSNPKDDVVTCQDVVLTGSRTPHRECHTRREWRTMQ